MASPALDDDPGLFQSVEDFAVQKLVAQLRVEALAIAILPRTARHDVGRLRSHGDNPFPQRLGDELGAIVGSNVDWDAAQDEQV